MVVRMPIVKDVKKWYSMKVTVIDDNDDLQIYTIDDILNNKNGVQSLFYICIKCGETRVHDNIRVDKQGNITGICIYC